MVEFLRLAFQGKSNASTGWDVHHLMAAGCGRESRRRRLFFTSVDGYHPSACDLKGLKFAHRARVAELEGRTPENRREREGGGTGGCRESRKDPAAYASLRIWLLEKPPKFQQESRICEMRRVCTHVACLYSVFSCGRLAVPLQRYEIKGTPSSCPYQGGGPCTGGTGKQEFK